MKRPARKSLKFYYLVLIILAFGLLMVFNASQLYSQRLFGNALYISKLQLIWTLTGLLIFVFFRLMSLKFIKSISKGLFGFSIVILVFVAVVSLIYPCHKVVSPTSDIAFCPCKNGARRWINLNPPPLPQIPFLGILGFQASDLAKLSMVMYLPLLLELKLKSVKRRYEAFAYYFAFCFLVSFLILLQPNMSSAGLIVIIGVVMYFISGADLRPLSVLVPVMMVLALLFIVVSPYRRERFLTLVSPNEQSTLEESYQSEQILIGLGSGGIRGVGAGQSKQKQHYLPEVIGDSIFAIIGEELGFIGSLVVVSVFAFLALELVGISSKAVTLYEKMLGMGVAAWIFFQYLINLYATIGLIPFTGMPIPFISYGGSSMVFALAGMGLISNIHRRQSS